jgi:anaerobic selenocysteine-containing dehydrogenase
MMDIVAFKNVISRRSLLKGAPLVAATVVSLDGLTPGEATAQQAKLSQALSKYQDTPKNGQQCSTCSHFVAPASCAIVVDPIKPEGWCQFYVAKT